MDQPGSLVESLLAPDRGSMAIGATTAGVATLDVGRPFPGPEDIAADSVTVTPGAALTVGAASMAEAATSTVEAEAVPMVVGAGKLHHQLAALAADDICRRPLPFGSHGAALGARAR
jgi:hypothetical protein